MLNGTPLYALNVGGPTLSADGVTWLSDSTANAGFTANYVEAHANADSTTNSIDVSDPSVSFTGRADNLLDQSVLTLNPNDYATTDAVFETWRYDHDGGENLEYNFGVTPGKYRVDLYFVETSEESVGSRVFDVLLEGVTVLNDFDIYSVTGGKNIAVGRSFVVDSNSQLDLKLINQTGTSILHAIRVAEATPDIDRSFNPSTFNAANINQIQDSDVVELQPGTYQLSSADLDALLGNSTGQRNNITLRGVPGQSILDFRSQSTVEWIQFDKWVQGHNNHYIGMNFDGLTFLNAGIFVNRGTGFTIQNSIFDGFEGKTHPNNDRILSVWKTDNASLLNNYVRWNNTSENINAIGVGGGNNGHVMGNKVEGLLRKALQFWRYADGLIEHNDIERWAQTPGAGNGTFEDHGYYIHDSSHVQILSNAARGWSDTSAGNSVKIKNVDHIEVAYNNFYTSGIIGRVETAVENPRFEHIWIHDNIINRGQIDIWTPSINPTAVRIESNVIPNHRINVVRDVIPSLFNQTVDLNGGIAGGIYDNNTESYNFTAGINESGNTIHLNADFDSDRDVDGADFLMWQRGYGTPIPYAGIADGDADDSTSVDVNDLSMWGSSFGNTANVVMVSLGAQSSPVVVRAAIDSSTSETKSLRGTPIRGALVDAAIMLDMLDDSSSEFDSTVYRQSTTNELLLDLELGKSKSASEEDRIAVDTLFYRLDESHHQSYPWLTDVLLERTFD